MLASWLLLSSLVRAQHALVHPDPLPERASPQSPEFAPPDAVPHCFERLTALGVKYRRSALPVHKKRGSTIFCGAPQVLRYRSGPGGIELVRAPQLSCPMALAMARFEVVAQRLAKTFLSQRIVKIHHAGTYNCREMRNYPGWVSEHSYANALDIKSFELQGGKRLTVGMHYRDQGPRGAFFRAMARSLVEKRVFSVVLTPNFDGLHKRHLHLDLARYRVDGT